MALPQQVLDRLSSDTQQTPQWSSNLLLFSIGTFLVVALVYFGITMGYEPILNSQISQIKQQIDTAGKSISVDQQGALVGFYSGLSHLQTLLNSHVVFTPFFSWLEKNTGTNVYYSHVVFSSGSQVAITVDAKTQADLDQQLAVFEVAPQVSRIAVSGVAPLQINGSLWQQASIVLFMKNSVFSYSSST